MNTGTFLLVKSPFFEVFHHRFGWVFCPFLRINVALSWAETSCMSESTCSSFDTEEATDFDCEVGKKCRDDDFLSPYINVYIYIYQCAMVKLLLLDCIHSLWEIVISPFSQGYEIYIYVFCIYIYTHYVWIPDMVWMTINHIQCLTMAHIQ